MLGKPLALIRISAAWVSAVSELAPLAHRHKVIISQALGPLREALAEQLEDAGADGQLDRMPLTVIEPYRLDVRIAL